MINNNSEYDIKKYLKFEKNADGITASVDVIKLRELVDSCLYNAREFIESSELVRKARIYSVSILLSILAIEELGKRRMVGQYVWVEDDDKEKHKLWTAFRTHKDKLYWALKALPLKIDKNHDADYIRLWFEQDKKFKDLSHLLDCTKLLMTYTNVMAGDIGNPSRYKNKRKISKDLLSLARQLWEYQSNVEPSDKLIKYFDHAKSMRKPGETLVKYIERVYSSVK